jgi:acrylyl-CoA reductase (NADPH)
MGTESFRALVATRDESKRQSVEMRDVTLADLTEGDTLVRVTHTTVNYKDGLAVTGRAPIVRQWPMIPGIDFAGVVVSSEGGEWQPGDEVVLTGWGAGERHTGGYAGYARVPGEWLVRRPAGLTAAETMAIGTAGFTAMLSVLALERHGLTPDRGEAIVTGAAGGVGSIAIALLTVAGWRVAAVTGRPEEAGFLEGLGATEVLPRSELAGPVKPVGATRWAAGVDSVGSTPLANMLSMMADGGAVAACGMAAGLDLPASVAPFILRGVSLLGINSVYQPRGQRVVAWDRLARDLDRTKLAEITTTVGFEELLPTAEAILEGRVRGRVVVEVSGAG